MAGKGKVLLMDDEQIILDVTLEVLRFLEYDGDGCTGRGCSTRAV